MNSNFFLKRMVLCLPLILSGCGESEETPSLTFLVALLPSEQAQYQRVLEPFTERTGIEVRLVSQQYEQIQEAIAAEAAGGRGRTDLVELDLYQLPLVRQHMQPLAPLMAGEETLRAHVADDAWAVGEFGDPPQLLYLPHRLNWQAMIYDAEALGEPPGDWTALLAAAREHPNGIGLKLARYEGLVCDIFPFLWQAGADPLAPATPEAARAMAFLRDLAPQLNTSARSFKEQSALQAQEQEEIVLHYNWPFVVPLLRDKDLLPDRVRTAPLPGGPAGAATVLGGGYLGVPAGAPNPQAAGQLLDYLAEAQTQQMLVRELGWFPIRDEGWQALSDEDRTAYGGFLAMREDVRARPNVPYYSEVSRAWQNAVHQMLFEDAPIEATLQQLDARIAEMRQ